MPTTIITKEQRRKLEDLWFVYGNGGPKHTHAGHRFIQTILEHGEDARKFFKPSREVIRLVDGVLKS